MKIKNSSILIMFFILTGTIIVPYTNAGTHLPYDKTTIDGNNNNHPPIFIEGNENFTYENGVTGGSGTEEDPYIIENWIIVGNGSISDGIFINNTDVYFVIRNCTVYGFHHPDEYYDGIELQYVENGRIENTKVNESHACIHLRYSTNIKISNSTFCDYHKLYGYGISCYRSKYISIKSCECYNLDVGIHLSKSSDIVVDNTNCYDNNKGLTTWSLEPITMYLVITNCKFFNNKYHGICLIQREFHPSYSKIINCEFYNNGIGGKGDGLRIERHCNNIIENCSFHDNWQGIDIKSDNNIIRNCSIYNHGKEGISIVGYMGVMALTKKNKIINCDVYNNMIGILFWTSVGSVVEKCNIYNNSWHGIYNGMFSMIQIKHNNIFDNGYDETYEVPCGLWSMWFCFVDARNNWWNAEDGPKRYRYGYLGIIPIRLRGSEKIIHSRSIVHFRPWATEPITDAGVN
jgi:parallel beta-helix repeat protein